MKLSVSVRRVLLAAALATATVVVPVSTVSPVSAATCTLCGGGEYHAIDTPSRVLDTRSNPKINDVDPLNAKLVNGSAFVVDLLGIGSDGTPTGGYTNGWLPSGVTPADVLAVAATVTVVGPTVGGYLAVAPGDTAPTGSSLINFLAHTTTANLAVLRPDATGKLSIGLFPSLTASATGTADVLIDVFGWFTTSGYLNAGAERGGRLIPTDPGRILDTRTGLGGITPGPGDDLDVTVVGASTVTGTKFTPVPIDSNITAVMVNITAVAPTGSSSVFVAALGTKANGTAPTSNLNLMPGQTRAATAIVPLGTDGHIHLYNGGGGKTPLLVDVVGYFINGQPESTRAGRVVPLSAPFRAFDTRLTAFGKVPLGPGQAEDWSFAAFAASVNIGGTSVGNQLGFIGNLTNAALSRQYPTVAVKGFLTVYPTPTSSGGPPVVSNLNSNEFGAVANMALVKYGANQTVRVYNASGYADYIVDVSAVVLND